MSSTAVEPRVTGPTHRVVALVGDGVSMSELGQAGDVIRAANEAGGAAGAAGAARVVYELVACTTRPGPVRTQEGYDLQIPTGLDAVASAATVLLPGCWAVDRSPGPDVLTAVRAAHRRGARVVATCTGVAVAAAAGLLDGRTATTHWRHAQAFAHAHPQVLLRPDVLYVDHGDIATSAGLAAGLDLHLHLLRHDTGSDVTAAAAQHLIAARHRAGDQPQQLPDPLPLPVDDLTAVLDHLTDNLQDREPVTAVAQRLGLSERTLRRRFRSQLGTTPGRWILTQRLHHAQRLLETTDLPIETIAHRIGLASATALRRQFHTLYDQSPSEHRRAHRP